VTVRQSTPLRCLRLSHAALPLYSFFFLSSSGHHPDLHSFPTRRSSDLGAQIRAKFTEMQLTDEVHFRDVYDRDGTLRSYSDGKGDRKSTRLNSSHVSISYAVFCLKKKNKKSATRLYVKRKNK